MSSSGCNAGSPCVSLSGTTPGGRSFMTAPTCYAKLSHKLRISSMKFFGAPVKAGIHASFRGGSTLGTRWRGSGKVAGWHRVPGLSMNYRGDRESACSDNTTAFTLHNVHYRLTNYGIEVADVSNAQNWKLRSDWKSR